MNNLPQNQNNSYLTEKKKNKSTVENIRIFGNLRYQLINVENCEDGG
jgi:hypothetical protein